MLVFENFYGSGGGLLAMRQYMSGKILWCVCKVEE